MIVPKQSIRESLEANTQQYQKDLADDQEAQDYLTERGISNQAADYFRLGVVRNPSSDHEKYKGRISFPYITPSGVVAIRFRTIGPHGDRAKFLSMSGDIARPYNTRALLDNREVYICEGETDTIASYECGLAAIGFPGVTTWGKDSRVFSRMLANRSVCVLGDSDDSGEGAGFADEIYRSLGGCRIVMMPKSYDVSKLVLEQGPEALLKRIHEDS